MPTKDTHYEVDEYLEPGLRYTEEIGHTVRSLPVRYCFLWLDDQEESVSGLEVLSFKQRFGANSIPSEGIGGVETTPHYRRQGYMTRLMTKTLEGIAGRVDVAFISEAIEGVYESFGFVSCLAEAHLIIPVGKVEQRLGHLAGPDGVAGIREYVPEDLTHIVGLYNEAHAQRPWTHERHASWNRLIEQQMWRPGSKTIVFEAGGHLRGYAILQGKPFGRVNPPFVVDELTAADPEAAQHLFAALSANCWQQRLGEFMVREPFDSLVGRQARLLGCSYNQSYPTSGDMMAAIIHRQRLLEQLAPELRRRVNGGGPDGGYETAFRALQRGDLVPDNGALLRLLLGYWSAADALTVGPAIPESFEHTCTAWFPGGGTPTLLAPYAHKLDRY